MCESWQSTNSIGSVKRETELSASLQSLPTLQMATSGDDADDLVVGVLSLSFSKQLSNKNINGVKTKKKRLANFFFYTLEWVEQG